jgi:hypothetical protein
MAAQIKPWAVEVSDRFPTLGFTIQSDRPSEAEVVLATDPSLFRPENEAQRNASNFYSSREDGTTQIRASTGAFEVPARVLARFVGNDRLYFALVVGRCGAGGRAREPLPHTVNSFVWLRNFTRRPLR